jgi:hypothetical protein
MNAAASASPIRDPVAEERRVALDQLTPGRNFRIVGTVERVELRAPASTSPYLRITLRSPDRSRVEALALNTPGAQLRTIAAATMEPGREVRLRLRAITPDMGFIDGIEVKGAG